MGPSVRYDEESTEDQVKFFQVKELGAVRGNRKIAGPAHLPRWLDSVFESETHVIDVHHGCRIRSVVQMDSEHDVGAVFTKRSLAFGVNPFIRAVMIGSSVHDSDGAALVIGYFAVP